MTDPQDQSTQAAVEVPRAPDVVSYIGPANAPVYGVPARAMNEDDLTEYGLTLSGLLAEWPSHYATVGRAATAKPKPLTPPVIVTTPLAETRNLGNLAKFDPPSSS